MQNNNELETTISNKTNVDIKKVINNELQKIYEIINKNINKQRIGHLFEEIKLSLEKFEKEIHSQLNNINQSLVTILKNKDLGIFNLIGSSVPTVEEIKKNVRIKNINLDTNAILISNITTTSAKIAGNCHLYYDEVTVNFKTTTNNFKKLNVTGTIIDIDSDKENNIYFGVSITNSIDSYIAKYLVKKNQIINMSGTNFIIRAITIDKKGNIYAGGESSKIYKSNNLVNFNEIYTLKSKGYILSLATDNDNNIYAGILDKHLIGGVYKNKFVEDESNFQLIPGTKGEVRTVIVDNNGNVYAGTRTDEKCKDASGKVYQCLAGTNTFKPMLGTSGGIWCSIIDKVGNVYVGSDNGNVYKCLVGEKKFIPMLRTKGIIYSITVDEYNNVYVGTKEGNYIGKIYKCLTNENTFKPLNGTTGVPHALHFNKNGNFYVGSWEGESFGTVYYIKSLT